MPRGLLASSERPSPGAQAIWPFNPSPAPAAIWGCIQDSPQLPQAWFCPQIRHGARSPAPKQAVPLGNGAICSSMARARALLSLAGEFVISPVEGELRVRKDAELDRENIPFYNLTIAARDRGVPPLSSTVSPPGWREGLWGAIPTLSSFLLVSAFTLLPFSFPLSLGLSSPRP